MSRKIKFHTFHVLFRLFAYLADKSGGWRMFVRPKLMQGSLLVGFGLTGCGTKAGNKFENKTGFKSTDSIKVVDVNQSNGLHNKIKNNNLFGDTHSYCYVPVNPEEKKYPKQFKSKDRKDSRNIRSSSIRFQEPMVTCYDTEIIIAPTDSNRIYEIVEQMPQFPGGDDSLLLYLAKNIKYPGNESLQNIQGKVVCRLLINKNGSVSNIEVLRSLDPILDTIVINVIKSMPDFIPGRQYGKIVRTYYTLPIHFKNQE